MSILEHPAPSYSRPSACARASLQAETERVRRMSVEERMLAALGMRSKFAGFRPAPIVELELEHESP